MRLICRIAIILSLFPSWSFAQDSLPAIKSGFLDARLFDFTNQRLPLRGTWIWYDNQLLDPTEVKTQRGTPVQFPEIWNEVRANKSGQGYATYKTSILMPEKMPAYGLDIPEPYCSYKLWANGKLVAQHGEVGTTEETTEPLWFSTAISINKPKGDTLELVLQIANFHHYKGGVKNDFYLGDVDLILKKRNHATISTLIECGALFIMALTFFIIYFQQKRKKIVIYFALFCLTWSLRSVLSNDYVFFQYFNNFNWASGIRFEYFTLYLTMIWCILFLSRLFASDSYQTIKYVLVSINCIFIAFTLLTPTTVFTKWLFIYLFVAGLLILYGVFVVVKASINERVGANFLILSILMAIVAFGYDILTYQDVFAFNAFILSSAYIITFMLMAFALLLHLNIIKSKPKTTNILTYAELYKDDAYKVK